MTKDEAIATLRAAATAVVSRWDSPKWKDEPHTAEVIASLREALADTATTAPSSEPVAYAYECRQPLTDPVIWAEFFGRDKPSESAWIRNVRALYAEAPAAPVVAVPEWISTDDRMPDDRQDVLFIAACPSHPNLHGRRLGGRYSVSNDGFCVPGMTVYASAWMPFPVAPAAPKEPPTLPEEWMDDLRELVSDFRKATYEFARGQDPADNALMMERQRQIFAHVRTLAAPAAPLNTQPKADEQFVASMLAEVVRMGASEAGLSLAAQLFGVAACEACGYRKLHCRCAPLNTAAPTAKE